MIEYDKNLIHINDDDNEGVDLSILTPKSSRLIVVRCNRCNNPWSTRPRELFYNRTSCPVCRKNKEYNENAISLSPKYHEVLYPMLIDKESLENRGDTSQYTIDVVCPDCSKAFRITISSAVKRIDNNSPICWMCDSRKGGRTGELFMYNYPELVSRIRDEVPDTDFLVSDPREFMFEYDCGHSEKIRTRNFVCQHKRCSECKRDELSKRLDFLLELREKAEKRKIRANTKPVKKKKTHCKTYYMFKRSRPKHVEVVCSKCDKQFTIQTSSYLRNIKKHNMRYICNICASSKGIRLSEKLKSPEFAHVLWSDKNEFSPDEITASSGRRVILECEKGHEWSPFAYAIGGCPQCMQGSMTSKEEESFASFLSSLLPNTEIRRSVRGLIYPQEVDIYIPSKQVAIEFNGLYWHSEKAGKDKDYHYNKWLSCKNKGVQLITVWEDDWRYRRDAVTQYITEILSDTYSTNLDKDISLFLESNVIDDSMLSFLDKYSLYDQQYIIDESSSFIIGQDSSGLISSISAVSSYSNFNVIGSHVCKPGFEWNSLTGVFGYLQNTGRYDFGFLDSKDNPVIHDDLLEILGLNSSIDILPARRNCKYENNSSFRVKCDKDYDRWIWNSGYTLWYA